MRIFQVLTFVNLLFAVIGAWNHWGLIMAINIIPLTLRLIVLMVKEDQ